MGAGSLLQGDLLRQSLRSCLDYAGSNGEGRRSCCPQHEYSWGALETQRPDPDSRQEKKCPWGETECPDSRRECTRSTTSQVSAVRQTAS